jgi:hypothetical protein
MELSRFVAFVALATSGGVASAGERTIELFWSNPVPLERKLKRADRLAAEREVVRIYREIGIVASFPPLAAADGGEEERPPAFHVILVDRSGEGFRLSRQAMGAILEKRPANRTVFLFLPVILNAMRDPAEHERKLVHDARNGRPLARAVGRVVAHEIAHVIDPEMPHGPPESLMSEHLSFRMLWQDRLGFDDATAARLRDGVDQMRKETSGGN